MILVLFYPHLAKFKLLVNSTEKSKATSSTSSPTSSSAGKLPSRKKSVVQAGGGGTVAAGTQQDSEIRNQVDDQHSTSQHDGDGETSMEDSARKKAGVSWQLQEDRPLVEWTLAFYLVFLHDFITSFFAMWSVLGFLDVILVCALFIQREQVFDIFLTRIYPVFDEYFKLYCNKEKREEFSQCIATGLKSFSPRV